MDSRGTLFGLAYSGGELISKNIETFRKNGSTHRWAYFTPTSNALNELRKLVETEQVKLH